MEATMLLLLLAILLFFAGRRSVVAGDGGFSVDFIHRDSPRSPFRHPALSPHARALAAARRSLQGEVLGRSFYSYSGAGESPAAAPVSAADGGVVSKIITRSFEYLMYVNVGTPPTQLLAIADTGSDLVWVNCSSNGGGGGDGPGDVDAGADADAGGHVVFQPSSSSTYSQVSCQSNACQTLSQASCDADSECQYQYSYGDGSRTIGVLSTETFSFVDGGGGGNGQVRVPRVNFGCSTVSTGTFRSDGLVGLGAGPFSLVSQLGAATHIDRRFSYCLVPTYEANASSTLNFGSRAVVSEPGAAATPLVPSDVDAYYTVALEAVAVAGQEVATQDSRIIVDSGTTLTFLDRALLEPLVAELVRRIKLPRVQPPEELLQLCYDVRGKSQTEEDDNFGIPDVTLRFGGGADVTLKPENTFSLLQEGTLCLVLVPVSESQPISILGNIAQQNFHVGYDLDKRTVTFAAADCTRSSASS